MTIKEFFESNDNLVIHCDTEEKAKKLLKAFDKAGYRWRNGCRYTTDSTYWYVHKKDTGYSNSGMYSNIFYCCGKGYKKLEFEEIEFELEEYENTTIEKGKQELRKELEKHWDELSNRAKEAFTKIFGDSNR